MASCSISAHSTSIAPSIIEDEDSTFSSLLKDLYWTVATDGPVSAMRYKGRVFACFDTWCMDNTQTLKGMKYF